MKGVNKCYGLLLVFFIMLGLSLNVSSDVSAYKYSVDTIPFGYVASDYTPRSSNFNSGHFLLYKPFSFSIPDGLDYEFHSRNIPYYFNAVEGDWSFQHGCVWLDGHDMIRVSGSSVYTSYTYAFPYYDSSVIHYSNSHQVGGSVSDIEPFISCNQLYESPLSFQIGSFPPYVFGSPNYRSYPPYRYNYNGIYVRDSNTSDGLNASTRFDFGDLFLPEGDNSVAYNIPSQFHSITLPLGFITSNYSNFHNVSFSVRGSFMFDSDDPSVDQFILNENFNPTLTIISHPSAHNYPLGGGDNQSYSNDYNCSYNLITHFNEPDIFPYELSFRCDSVVDLSNWSYISSYDSLEYNLGFTVDFKNFSSADSYIWDFPATNMLLSSFYVITDNDPSADPSGKSSFTDYRIAGNEKDNAPGSVSSSLNSNVDFLSSLSNLFNFSFINPFMPIFGMFASSDSCVNIPILSGMLHSDSSQVCPFFDSNVRNILTPVFTLSSMMLVFGFAVRWLGSGSGNMFTDDIKDTGGNYSLFNKYRRNR